MVDYGDAAGGVGERAPRAALALEDLRARRRDLVVATPALPRLLDPAPLNPSALLEAIEQRIERGDAKLQHTVRPRFDQLAQVVAVTRLIFEEREDQQLRAA